MKPYQTTRVELIVQQTPEIDELMFVVNGEFIPTGITGQSPREVVERVATVLSFACGLLRASESPKLF
jgi:hypothetical protein